MPRKLTYEEVKHFIEVESGSGCKLLSKEYKGSKDKLEIQCKCGNVFMTTYSKFKLSKKQCDICLINQKKLDYEYVKYFVEIESKSGCKLLSKEYLNNEQPLILKCKCGNIFKTNFNKFKHRNKRQCNNCGIKIRASKKRITIEQIKNDFKKHNLKLLSTTVNGVKEKLKIQCSCGRIFLRSYDEIKTQKRYCCNLCSSGRESRYTYEYVKRFIEVESGSGCKLLSDTYKRNDIKLDLLCSCGEKFKTTFHHFKNQNQRQCLKCSGITRWDCNKIRDYINKNNLKCELISNTYIRNDLNLKFKCQCGEIYEISWNNFLKYHKDCCNKCSSRKSHGVRRIEDFLKYSNLIYSLEHKYNLCQNKRKLLYDICIDNKLLVEYDGEQHFKPTDFAGKGDKWAINHHCETVKRDKIKNQYCIDNNIPLIRIPYWEYDNIEYILKNALMHFNLIQKDDTYDESIVKKYLVDENWDHDKYIEMSKNY